MGWGSVEGAGWRGCWAGGGMGCWLKGLYSQPFFPNGKLHERHWFGDGLRNLFYWIKEGRED